MEIYLSLAPAVNMYDNVWPNIWGQVGQTQAPREVGISRQTISSKRHLIGQQLY